MWRSVWRVGEYLVSGLEHQPYFAGFQRNLSEVMFRGISYIYIFIWYWTPRVRSSANQPPPLYTVAYLGIDRSGSGTTYMSDPWNDWGRHIQTERELGARISRNGNLPIMVGFRRHVACSVWLTALAEECISGMFWWLTARLIVECLSAICFVWSRGPQSERPACSIPTLACVLCKPLVSELGITE